MFLIFDDLNTINHLFVFCFIIIQFLFLSCSRIIRLYIIRKYRTAGYNTIKLLVLGGIDTEKYLLGWFKDKLWYGINIITSNKNRLDLYLYFLENIKRLNVGDYLIIDLDCFEDKQLEEIFVAAENREAVFAEIILKYVSSNISTSP